MSGTNERMATKKHKGSIIIFLSFVPSCSHLFKSITS